MSGKESFEMSDRFSMMAEQGLSEESLVSSLERLYEYAKRTKTFRDFFSDRYLSPDASLKIPLDDNYLIRVKLLQSTRPLAPSAQTSSLSLDSYDRLDLDSYDELDTDNSILPSSSLVEVDYFGNTFVVQLHEDPLVVFTELEELLARKNVST